MGIAGSGISRRGFLGGAGALAAAAGSIERLEAARGSGAPPANIIFMVADGMSAGVLPLAERFSQLVRGKGLLWRALMDRPGAVNALVDMASLDSAATDSAAAATSWGSGARVFNGSLNTLPDGRKLTTIADIARDRGKRVGLVTTATVTHATPAGFVAVQASRSDEADIAVQYLGKVDVILGGGLRFFEASSRKDRADLIARYRLAGYNCAASRKELAALSAGIRSSKPFPRLLGLFSASHIPYVIDRNSSESLRATTPTLAEMTAVALEALRASSKGFLLQVEGGRVDHAAHDNDAATLLWEQLDFDEAIETVLRFVEGRPETLVVATTDHGNSNPGMSGEPAGLGRSANGFSVLARAKRSFSEIMPRIRAGHKSGSAVRDLIRESLGVALSEEEAEVVRKAASGAKGLSVNRSLDKLAGVLGQAAGNYNGVGWTCTDHTSDYAVLSALGPGSERFAGQIRNTKCFENMVDLMGSKFRNPSMTLEQARKHPQAVSLTPAFPHWV